MTEARALLLGALGDLVEDIRVTPTGPIRAATDTHARVVRTRGGSAANVATAAAAIDGRARFIGQVGADAVGAAMAATLDEAGVELAGHRGGRTGTVVVLVDPAGERTMLTDRGSAHELSDPSPNWLEGLHTLHVPAYSLVTEPLATTASTLIAWARARTICVSIDLSSTAAIAAYGIDAFVALVVGHAPTVVFGNADEAAAVHGRLDPVIDAGGTIVVHGADEASAHHPGGTIVVPTTPLASVADTTGAGDAFAAGFLCATAAGAGLADAMGAGHAAARRHLTVGLRAPR